MAELNIGALTDSTSYTGSFGTANTYDLYKFNITSPGSFKFAIDNLSGNADIFLLNNSGATLYSSTNAGNAAETINADSLVAGDYSVKVLPITGDIKYTLNLAPTKTQTTSAADTLTGAKSDSSLSPNSPATLEKTTANKDVITGDAVGGKTVTAETKTATTEKPVSSTSETTAKSEPEKTVTATASATSATPDRAVSSSSETTIKSVEKTVIETATTTNTTEKPVTSNSEASIKSAEKAVTETATTTAITTEKPVTSNSETSIKSAEKAVTETATPTATTTEKPVTSNSAKAPTTSETTEIKVTTSAETTIKTEPEKTATAGETVASQATKTSENVAAVPDASKAESKPNPATTNGEDKKTENANTAVPTAETPKKIEPPTNKELTAANPFTSGVFVVDSTGKVSIDYILDGGLYRGQLAIISLKGMDKFVPGSPEFFKEAAARAMSNSEKGYIVIDDLSEGARFNGNLPEGNFNEGAYLGVKTFAMTPGDEFGIMMVPNDTVKFVYDYPSFGGDKRPLFSMVTANPNEGFHLGQIADVTGEGNTFTMEDLRFDLGTDKDYNDIVFQVRGAKGKAPLMDGLVNPDKDWRQTDLGKAVIAYAKPYVTQEPETKPNLEGKVTNLIDDLEKEILNPPSSDKETPKTPAPTATTDKDTNDLTKIVPTEKADETPAIPAVTNEKPIKDTTNSDNSTTIETAEKVNSKPTGGTTTPTADKDTAADNPEKLPVEKTPVSPTVAIEEKDKVAEITAATTLPDRTSTDSAVAATKPTEKVETKPEVLPAETKTETEVVKTEIPKVGLPENSVGSAVEESQQIGAIEPNKTAEVQPNLPVQETGESIPVTAVNKGEESPAKEIVTETETAGISDVTAPKESLPTSQIVEETTENNSIAVTVPANPDSGNPSPDVAAPESELDFSVSAALIARLESMKQSLNDNRSADDPSQGISSQDWIDRLNKLTEKLIANQSATVSDRTVALVERLEETVDRIIQPPIQPPLQSIDASQFDFPVVNQPIIGVIDTGFAGNNPDIDYSRITWGQDRVDGDADPRIEPGKGNEHGTHVLGIIAATQNNALGIDGINEKAPIWAGRAIGSGKWAESLVEFVNAAIESKQPNAVVNLSLDLTQINPDGSVTTRYEFTPEERSAIEYARQNNVLLVVAAGNDGGVMSALGQSSQEFDNIITVGAAERVNDEIALSKAFDRTEYSSYGYGLDVLAPGGTIDNPELSTVGDGVGFMAGTSVASAKVTGAISQIWAANPRLNYRQVIQIIKDTATDLKSPDWDEESGTGLLNIAAAVHLATAIEPINFPKDDVIGPGERLPVDPLTGVEYKPGEILVKFKPGVTETEISMLAQTQGAIAIENLFAGDTTDSTNGQWKVLKFAQNTDLVQIRAALALDSNVAGIELNYKLSINATRDPMVNSLWGLNNTGQTGGSADADIDAPEAWRIQTGSKDITVAVIDTGGDYRHQDLAANTWRNTGEIGGNGIDDDNNGFVDDVHGYDFVNTDGDPMDDEGHGTHVAGTIGAVGNNSIGVVGVNHNVSLMHLKFLNSGGSGYTDDAARAIDYATRMGAKVINASFGGGGYSQSMFDAISRANDAGVLFVAAAGNNANNNDLNPDFPTNYDLPNIISVAATDDRDRLAWFSNYGRDTVDLAAPGVNILSTLPGNRYGQLDGTSMATPHVAGAAALLLAQNPNQSPTQLKNILMESADRVASLEGTTLTGGRLNIDRALNQIAPPPRPNWEIAIENEHQQTKGLLGNPKNDSYFDPTPSPAGTTGKGKDYEFGSIHWSEKYGAVALWGDLQREYEEYDSPNGSGGWLGFPTRREYDWNGGRRTDFEGGYIYWDGVRAKAYRFDELPPRISDPDWQTAIENEYQQTKWLLGNPRNDTYFDPTPSPAGTTGKGKDYEFGSIHWSEKYGAVALWHDLQREYEEYGSPNGSGGWLGFPTRREYDWNGGRRTDFEGGYIYWDGVRAKAYRLNELPSNSTLSNPTTLSVGMGRVNSRVGSIPLNLRRQPNTSRITIGRLPVGTQLKILRTVDGGIYNPGTGNRKDWYEVEVNGQRGFVAAYYVDKVSSAPPPPQSGFVNSNVGSGPLRLRSSAATNAAILTNLSQGTRLKILRSVTGATYQPGNRQDWYEVEVNGRRGFVAAYYVTQGSPSQTDPGSGGTNPNMEAFFGWAKGQVGITRRDGLYNLRGQCVTLIARYVQEVFLPANQRTVPRAFGHGKDTASVVSQMLPNNFGPATSSGLPKRGAIISFPEIGIVDGILYGHVGIVMESRQLSNGQRQVRIMDSNGDNLATNSTVKEYPYWINIPNGTANGYGAKIYWTNPK